MEVEKIKAYYSLVFPKFTYYLQTLEVTIGRRCGEANSATAVDVDLGPLKSVSRLHAKIEFEEQDEHFVLVVIGRNGAWVDGVWSASGSRVALGERSQIQIASRTFHFVLPPLPPVPEPSPSPSTRSSTTPNNNADPARPRSPSVDVVSISPPSSLPSLSPPSPLVSLPRIKIPKQVPKPVPKPEPVKAAVQPEPVKQTPIAHKSQPSLGLPNSNNIQRPKPIPRKRDGAEASSSATPIPITPVSVPADAPATALVKPAITYTNLIFMALTAIAKRATLPEICAWIVDKYIYYKQCDGNWMNSVRQNLSSSRLFAKGERCGNINDRGKGFYWTIDHDFAKSEAGIKALSAHYAPPTKIKKIKSSALEPALKRSVKGDGNNGPLPPALASASGPLPSKSTLPTTTTPIAPPKSALPAKPTATTATASTSTLISSTNSEYKPSPMSIPNPYAPSWLKQTPAAYLPAGPQNYASTSAPATVTMQAPIAQSPLSWSTLPPHPSPSVYPTATSNLAYAGASLAKAPTIQPKSIQSLPPPAIQANTTSTEPPKPPPPPRVPIIMGFSPNQPSTSDPNDGPSLTLHEGSIYLAQRFFKTLPAVALDEIEILGAEAAMHVLKGHVSRCLEAATQTKIARVRKRPRPKAKAGTPVPSSPFTHAPLPQRTVPAPTINNIPLPTSGAASPILIVDESDDERPDLKRQKLES